MTRPRIGLIGYGKIGSSLHERIAAHDAYELAYVYSRGEIDPVDDGVEVVGRDTLGTQAVDLVVEAATGAVVESVADEVLSVSDLMVLSTTALADRTLGDRLVEICDVNDTQLYIPHGAILGTDGLQDAQSELDHVHIETRKNPSNIDFSDADSDPVDGETVLYDGPTRGICAEFPRNVNSHATVALAGVGFEHTESTLISDPATDEAIHRITAKGDGITLSIKRESAITGVTGEYTLASIWGSLQRVLDEDSELVVL